MSLMPSDHFLDLLVDCGSVTLGIAGAVPKSSKLASKLIILAAKLTILTKFGWVGELGFKRRFLHIGLLVMKGMHGFRVWVE